MSRAARPGIRRALTAEQDPAAAAAHLYAGLAQPDTCLVLLFAAPSHDLPALAQALAALFGPVPVVGCTTAGEIGPGGYAEGALAGVSLAGPDFAAAIGLIEDLGTAEAAVMQAEVRRTRIAIHDAAPWARHEHLFAITLIDGLSGREEMVISAAYGALAGIPIRGGSAGDGLRFGCTRVLHEGRWRSDCALVIVVATRRRFRAFKTEHFVAGPDKNVVTGAEPRRRVVTEINAEPAALEYARITGLARDALTPSAFATHPMLVRIGDQGFVRSIQRAEADDSLVFYSAIDEGVVLRVAHGVDLVRNLEQTFAAIAAELGPPEVTLGFDCILRGLELDQTQARRTAATLMDRAHVLGFCTYGEQYEAMHVNQTLSGIAIAAADG